jgi:arylsulfatase
LRDADAPWPDRTLFTHVGRWPKGASPQRYKYAQCSVRSPRWHLVSDWRPADLQPKKSDAKKAKAKSKAKVQANVAAQRWQLFDVSADPGEQTDVAAKHPDVVADLTAAYDKWWDSVQPQLVNEDAVGPKVNPFKELYWKQFGGGPKEANE